MSTATSGRAREYKVRDQLIAHGFELVMRSAGSKGAADLAMARADIGLILVQVGTDKKSLGPADRIRFVKLAAAARAKPILATVTRQGIEYRVVNQLTPRWWGQWNPHNTPKETE
jgi:tRNA splicing endonuclease